MCSQPSIRLQILMGYVNYVLVVLFILINNFTQSSQTSPHTIHHQFQDFFRKSVNIHTLEVAMFRKMFWGYCVQDVPSNLHDIPDFLVCSVPSS